MPLIDYNTVLQGPLYTVLSTAATLTSAKNPSLGTVAIQVVDKISGIAVGNKKDRNHQHADFETVVPGAYVRLPDLTALGWTRADLIRGTLTMNAKAYKIVSAEPKTTVEGEANGELILQLEELANG